jgi:hypothetical protein
MGCLLGRQRASHKPPNRAPFLHVHHSMFTLMLPLATEFCADTNSALET